MTVDSHTHLIQLNSLTASELSQYDRSRTLILIAVGALDDFGPHLPMGVSCTTSIELCNRIGIELKRQRPIWQVLLAPPLPLSVEGGSARSINVRAHVLKDALIDLCRGYSRLGFKQFGCVSSVIAPRQLVAIETAGKALGGWFSPFTRTGARVQLHSLSSALVTPVMTRTHGLGFDPPEHGGALDTSLALALGMCRPTAKELVSIPRPQSKWIRLWQRFRKRETAYWGSPSAGSAARGENFLNDSASAILARLIPVLEGSPPGSLFRTWWSLMPQHKPYFRAWFFVFVCLAALIVTFWMTLNGV